MATLYRLAELAERIGAELRGNPAREISGIATLEDAGPTELSFLTHPRYREAAAGSRAGALLVGPDADLGPRDLLVAAQPYAALVDLLALFHPVEPPRPGVSPDARVAPGVELGSEVHVAAFAVLEGDVRIGDRVSIGAGTIVGRGCHVGDDTVLHPRVVLYPGTLVGRRCIVHSGAVLGADGFGFATVGGRHRKIPQVGRVAVGDEVEIGANSAIDRAMLGETRVGEGSKIDDLVMVAHGVRLGPAALVAAQAGIAGSARLGARATLAGQSGVAGHLRLGDGVIVAAKSAVFADVPDGAFVAGIPATASTRWKRSQALVAKLPELRREMRQLDARLRALERRLGAEEERS